MHWKRHLLVLIAALVGIGVLAAFWSVASKHLPAPAAVETEAAPVPIDQPLVTFVDPTQGPKDADVTIIEFGDHSCPYCRSTQQAIDDLRRAYPARVRFVWKSAPSPLHPGSETAATAALCAGRQGKFWEFHASLFEDTGLMDEASMVVLANDLGLDGAAFAECLSTKATLPLVERTVTEARGLGLTGIPTLFINGVRHEGAMDYDQLVEAAGL